MFKFRFVFPCQEFIYTKYLFNMYQLCTVFIYKATYIVLSNVFDTLKLDI